MLPKSGVLAIAILTGLAASNGTAWAQQGNQPAPDALGPGCHFGEVIDSSTADDACKKIEAVGFTNVHELKKSCDNFWHGRAVLSGHPVRVVLSPAGKVMLESD